MHARVKKLNPHANTPAAVTSVSVKGKNGKYDFAIKRTTDNVLQILLQVSR
jgi:hypothetical protein